MIARIIALAVTVTAVSVVMAGCGSAAPADESPDSTLTVFAAASLSESFREIATAYEQANPGVRIVFNFAGSQTLRTQLEHGATADVFASADWEQMAAVNNAGLLGNTPEYFAVNRLAVVAPLGSDAVMDLDDLRQPGTTIAVAALEVPAGAYTHATLGLMAESADYDADYAERVLANVVTNETNVRAVAQKAALGEVDAAFVYETDAQASQFADSFRVLEIPLQYNPAAEYPIGALAEASDLEQAIDFIAFVQDDAGQAILREHGFAPPANVACPCANGWLVEASTASIPL